MEYDRQIGAVRGRRLSSEFKVSGANGIKVGRTVSSLHVNKIDRAFKLEGAGCKLIGEVYSEDSRRSQREFTVQDCGETRSR